MAHADVLLLDSVPSTRIIKTTPRQERNFLHPFGFFKPEAYIFDVDRSWNLQPMPHPLSLWIWLPQPEDLCAGMYFPRDLVLRCNTTFDLEVPRPTLCQAFALLKKRAKRLEKRFFATPIDRTIRMTRQLSSLKHKDQTVTIVHDRRLIANDNINAPKPFLGTTCVRKLLR